MTAEESLNLSKILTLFLTFIGIVVGNNCELNVGVVSRSCSKSHDYIQNIDSDANGANLTVTLRWETVNSPESFLILQKVNKLKNKKVDFILIDQYFANFCVVQTLKADKTIPVVTIHDELLSFVKVQTKHNEDCHYVAPPSTSTGSFKIVSMCDVTSGAGDNNPYNELSAGANADVVGSILKNVLASLKWENVVVFHEKSTAAYVDAMTRLLFEDGTTVSSYAVDNYTEADIISKFNLTSNRVDEVVNFTIICHQECIRKIFAAAQKFGGPHSYRETFVRHLSQWLVFGYHQNATLQMPTIAKDVDNVAIIDLPTSSVRASSEDIKQLLLKILNPSLRNRDIAQTNSSEPPFDLDFLLMDNNQNYKAVLRSLMWGDKDRYVQEIGHVTSGINGTVTISGKIFPNKDFGFNRRMFKISTLEWAPFVIKEGNHYSGLCFDLLSHMAASLNFTYKVGEPPDGLWGGLLDNGSWTGLVGQLQRKEIDLTYAPLSVLSSREYIMDFAYPFYYDYTTVLLRKPDPLETKWRTLIDPFSDEVLISIGVALIFASTTLFLTERFSPSRRSKSYNNSIGLHNFAGAFWCIFGALLTQGGQVRPYSAPGRVFLSCWWLFCIVLMATYSGNLIAFLTVTKDTLPFTNLEEMTQQNKYKWGTIGGTLWVTALKNSKHHLYNDVYAGMAAFNKTDPSILDLNPVNHMQRVLAGDYAYIGDKTQMEIEMSTECLLQTIDEEFLPLHYAIGMQNNSPYNKLFSDEMLKIHESGLLQIWKTRRWPKQNFCHGDLVTEAKAITVIDVQSAFYLLGIGFLLSSVTCLCEKIYNKCKQTKPKNSSPVTDATIVKTTI